VDKQEAAAKIFDDKFRFLIRQRWDKTAPSFWRDHRLYQPGINKTLSLRVKQPIKISDVVPLFVQVHRALLELSWRWRQLQQPGITKCLS
jgi:hypothetical protein